MFSIRVIRGGDTVFTCSAPGVHRAAGNMIAKARDVPTFTVSVGIPTAAGHDWITDEQLSRDAAVEAIQEKSRGRASWLDAQNLVDNPGTMRLVPPGRGILSTPVKECRLVRVERDA